MLNKKEWTGVAVGYFIALVTSPLLPELISLAIPFVGLAVARSRNKQSTATATVTTTEVVPETARQTQPQTQAQPASPVSHQQRTEAVPVIDPEFAPVLEYLEVLEDMVISEGQRHNLDDEIVEKSLALFTRLQRVIPLLQDLNNGEVNHTIRRLVLKDLNSFITPFLRLSGENKTKNRRTLLNGLKDINSRISTIVERIEYRDLLELQTKADLIHSRYNESSRF